jgi:choline transporter-like protein 2/4/5
MYIDSRTADMQKSSKAMKMLMVGAHCMLWCFEKVARYITESAYIMVAIEGRGFCTSAWRSFKLLFTASLRIATTQLIAYLVVLAAVLGISLGCTAGTVRAYNELHSGAR